MQEEKSQRMENTHERRNETQSYSDILHGDIHGRKNRTPMQITQGIKNLEKAWEQLDENGKGIKMDNKVKQETIETTVKQTPVVTGKQK